MKRDHSTAGPGLVLMMTPLCRPSLPPRPVVGNHRADLLISGLSFFLVNYLRGFFFGLRKFFLPN